VKVGDLVELSASARKTRWASRFGGKVGVVVSIKKWLGWDSSMDTYTVQWMGELAPDAWVDFKRGDVKYVRIKK